MTSSSFLDFRLEWLGFEVEDLLDLDLWLDAETIFGLWSEFLPGFEGCLIDFGLKGKSSLSLSEAELSRFRSEVPIFRFRASARAFEDRPFLSVVRAWTFSLSKVDFDLEWKNIIKQSLRAREFEA